MTATLLLALLSPTFPVDDEAIDRLIRRLDPEQKDEIRLESIAELVRLGPDAKAALKPIVKALLKDKLPKVRSAAAVALKNMGKDAKPVVGSLIEALKGEKDADVKEFILDAVGRFGEDAKDAAPTLVELVKAKGDVGKRAAHTLGLMPMAAKVAVKELAEALGEKEMRSAAALALGRIGEPALEALTKASKDPDDDVRVESVLALGVIGKPAVPALVAALRDKEPDVRLNAAGKLEEIGSEAADAVGPLADVVKGDRSTDVRVKAMHALLKVAPAAKAFRDALEAASKDKNEKVADAAKDVLETLKRK